MEIKDIAVNAERMEEIRGGATVLQAAFNGPVINDADVTIGGSGPTVLNSSPVTSTSTLLQQNTTTQTATATDVVDISTLFSISGSVFDIA